MSGFAAFSMYVGLKLHFSSDYDYMKYGGRTNCKRETFNNRNDRYFFKKLEKKYSLLEIKEYFISNFIITDSWIGDLLSEECDENYKQWKKRKESLSYLFQQDLDFMLEKIDSPEELLTVKKGYYPNLLGFLMENSICLETVCMMSVLLNFVPMWSRKIEDTILWPIWQKRILKYSPFIQWDQDKIKMILKNKVKEYAETKN